MRTIGILKEGERRRLVALAPGIIAFDTPPDNGWTIEVTCVYHLPAVFTEDWTSNPVDHLTSSKYRAGIRELLPIELGLV